MPENHPDMGDTLFGDSALLCLYEGKRREGEQ
jgi:hypothetical protein